MGAVKLVGPCKGRMELQVRGTIQAPGDRGYFKSGSWVNFLKINGLTLSGSGTFDGKGKSVWGKRTCSGIKYCGDLPIVSFHFYLINSVI